uniref:Uncharacterized protein n=1 Tax=Arundo donax TaxID=35708 RepID=A0A0A8YYV4_ARUDO
MVEFPLYFLFGLLLR